MAFVACHVGVASGQREMCLGVMIKGGRDPFRRVVTVCAVSLTFLLELFAVHIGMAVLADLRNALKLDLLRADRGLVAIAAGDGAVRSN